MLNRREAIESFEAAYKYSNVDDENMLVSQSLVLNLIELLKRDEPRLITREEWDKWWHAKAGKRDPLYVIDYKMSTAFWILEPTEWIELAFLTGEIEIWNRKPDLAWREQDNDQYSE